MISREKESKQQRSKTNLKNDSRKLHKQNPQGSGRKDWHSNQMSSKNQSKSLIEPINTNPTKFQNQLSSIINRANLWYSFANDATQNSTRGVLFGPIQGYSGNSQKLSANPAELSLCQKQNKSNFCTRLCSGVNYLTHPKLCPTSKNCLRNTKRPQNTARKQEWREPFYSEQTLGTNTLTNSALGNKFDTNRTKIRIWMKNFTIEKHTGLMQISGQKIAIADFSDCARILDKLNRPYLIDNDFLFFSCQARRAQEIKNEQRTN